jgi:hypothetical protein
MTPEELRTRAVEAAEVVVVTTYACLGGTFREPIQPKRIAENAVAAAEPLICELVVGEVVDHIRRSAGITTGISQHVLRQTADQIEAVFGGSR